MLCSAPFFRLVSLKKFLDRESMGLYFACQLGYSLTMQKTSMKASLLRAKAPFLFLASRAGLRAAPS